MMISFPMYIERSSSLSVDWTVTLSGTSLSRLSHVSSKPPSLQFCTTAKASSTLQLEIPGRFTPPTVTLQTASFSLSPRQFEHGSSVMNEDSLDLVRSELVSLYVRASLEKTPSQGLDIVYEDPFSELNSKLITSPPEPLSMISRLSSSNSPNGTSVGIPKWSHV